MLEVGYREFKPSSIEPLYVEKMFQKSYRDKKGIKYFINCKYCPTMTERFRWNFSMNFSVNNKAMEIQTVQWIFVENEWEEYATLKDVENYFETVWKSLNADYYE